MCMRKRRWKHRGSLVILLLVMFLFSAAACEKGTEPEKKIDDVGSEEGEPSSDVNTGDAEEKEEGSTSSGMEDEKEDTSSVSQKKEEKYFNRESMLKAKMAEEETLQSDLIAGIDFDSISTVEDITYFTSVMANGERIRFEVKHIDITEAGIVIYPDTVGVSLDSVGKIYSYSASFDSEKEKEEEVGFQIGYGYTFTAEKTSVQSGKEIHTCVCVGGSLAQWNYAGAANVVQLQPNFVYFKGDPWVTESYLLTSLIIAYNPYEKTTEMKSAYLDKLFYQYIPGEQYDQEPALTANAETNSFDFCLQVKPKTGYTRNDYDSYLHFIPAEFYTVGDMRSADGTVLDKDKAQVYEGTTLEIFLGDSKLVVELPVTEQFTEAATLNELSPFSYPDAIGEKTVLVIPVVWSDQLYMADEEQMQLLKTVLGRVVDADGNLTDYSDTEAKGFSLSEYFDTASYGKLQLQSFLTDFYYTDMTFEYAEYATPQVDELNKAMDWVKETYPDMDWSKFDRDANGYADFVILLNLGEVNPYYYERTSYGGAVCWSFGYGDEYAGTPDSPNLLTAVTMNRRFIENGEASTLIHEFSHIFGLQDYYDVRYSGIDAVGSYDMQSRNKGDWNSYSKLAVGWMEPTVVTGLVKGESIEITIGSSALTDDVIIIPAAGKEYEGPFSEYVMIDLLTDDGVNAFDATEYDLTGVAGVRISHVNAAMELQKTELKSSSNREKIYQEYGTPHFFNIYNKMGRYFIEVIQAGKNNTFTNLDNPRTNLMAEDLFYAGDVFEAEAYDEFFYHGLMDSTEEFGYIVEIVSIDAEAPSATVRITAK